MLRISVMLLVLASCVNAQDFVKGSWMDSAGVSRTWQQSQDIQTYDKTGRRIVHQRTKTRKPVEVIDTVQFAGQYATFSLNVQPSRSRRVLTASSADRIAVRAITPIVTDSTKSAGYYTAQINRELNSITITSSNANDSSLVEVSLLIQ